ncbi:MAG: glycoside hydrolase family 127 protein, partial [Bacteroidaceae bacterium]|nr:glycoside hydrolase family 127 protein [Bacteroidaceae bacterium]
MKRIFLSLALLTGLAQLPTSSSPIMTCRAQTSVAVVERPELGSAAYRAPLHGGYLRKLPVGQVQPRGWLREFLNRQRAGLNGQLGTVSDWLDKNGNQWLSDTGSHGWEEVPYWLRGYASLAYVLDDEAMKREAQVWFDAVMTHLKPNGELGPSGTDGNPETPDLWAKMPMLWALQTYYEASGDERVLQAMTRYFKWELTIPDEHFLKGLWQAKRGGDNEWSVVWLYNQTGDETILPLISKLHRCGVDWTMKDDLPNWHGVNVAQGFREPATTYVLTGESRLLDAAYENFSTMRRRYGQVPGGMYGADENARAGYFDPRQGTETCALVEQMASDEILMGLTGDPFWADHCEDVALNSYAAALMPDMRSLRYLTAPNMAVSDERLHGPSIDNNLRGML